MAIVRITPYPFKVKYRHHSCYKCRSILTLTELGRNINSADGSVEIYDFIYEDSARYNVVIPIEGYFFRKAFLCQKCDYTIEIPTQITLEDSDIYLKKIQKRFFRKHNVVIERFFETDNGNMLKIFKNIDDIKNLALVISRDKKELAIYRSPVIGVSEEDLTRRFDIDKPKFIKLLKNTILNDDVLNTLRLHLSEYLGENDIEYSMEDDIMKFGFKIRDYDVEINFDTLVKSYQIKLENNAEKAIQKTLHLTMSKNYAEDLKSVMKDYKLSRKNFADHMAGLALMMKKYLARTGNLRFFEQAYFPDFNIDGIVI